MADRLLAIYAEIKDDYLRARGSDIEDVTQRILVALSGERPRYRNLTEDAVIVAEDLLPSAVAELDFEHARAIVTDAGGWASAAAAGGVWRSWSMLKRGGSPFPPQRPPPTSSARARRVRRGAPATPALRT